MSHSDWQTPRRIAAPIVKPSKTDLAGILQASHGHILYMENITVSFDGFRALDSLTLYVETGELRCIIGPNGAGKTTLMDVITGRTRPHRGVAYFGHTINLLRLSEAEIAAVGIGRGCVKSGPISHY